MKSIYQRLLRPQKAANPNQTFTRVKNIEYDKEGKVAEWLDSQFTVNYEDGSFGFLFYKDKGVEWHPLDEGKKKMRGLKPSDFVTTTESTPPISYSTFVAQEAAAMQAQMNELPDLNDMDIDDIVTIIDEEF